MDIHEPGDTSGVSVRLQAAKAVGGVFRRFGFELVPAAGDERIAVRRLKLLRDRHLALVIDGGANTGQYARVLRAGGYTGRIVSFEPLAGPFAELSRRAASDPAWEVRQLGLGDADGASELNVAGNALSSSLLPMSDLHVAAAPESAYVGTERVHVARLDSLRDGLGWPKGGAYLKLDLQGFEGHALQGARETLSHVEAVESELSLEPLYRGQALLVDVVSRLERDGFDLVALEPAFSDPRSGKLLQLDGLFVRRR